MTWWKPSTWFGRGEVRDFASRLDAALTDGGPAGSELADWLLDRLAEPGWVRNGRSLERAVGNHRLAVVVDRDGLFVDGRGERLTPLLGPADVRRLSPAIRALAVRLPPNDTAGKARAAFQKLKENT